MAPKFRLLGRIASRSSSLSQAAIWFHSSYGCRWQFSRVLFIVFGQDAILTHSDQTVVPRNRRRGQLAVVPQQQIDGLSNQIPERETGLVPR